MPGSRRCFLREARMAKRRKHRASGGQDARSERPATGMGSPGPRERLRFNRDSYQPWIVGGRRYPPFVVFIGLPVATAWWSR